MRPASLAPASVASLLPFCRLPLLFGGVLVLGTMPLVGGALISVALLTGVASVAAGAAAYRSPPVWLTEKAPGDAQL